MVYVKKKETLENRDKAEKHGRVHVYFPLSFFCLEMKRKGSIEMYDVVVIGAGVIGSAIARELSRYQRKTVGLEQEEDV